MKKFSTISFALLLCLSLGLFTACTDNNPAATTSEISVEAMTTTEVKTTNDLAALNRIAPPFEGVDVPFKTYEVEASKGRTIITKTGTVIIIPKDAFVDAQGNSVEGKVNINYREFHDASDIIASGIPMTNKDGDAYMETAGMFEIAGTQNEIDVQIAGDKDIEVKMGSYVKGKEFDFFQFDKKECNWDKKGTKAPEVNTAKVAKLKKLPKVPNQPIEPQKHDENAFVFDFDVNYDLFPELKAYHGVIWQYAGGTKNDPKKNDWIFEIDWKDITLKPTNNGKNFNLELKTLDKTFVTAVAPALKGDNYEKALATFSKRFEEYKAIKADRKVEETRLAGEANLLRSFRVNNFGVFNWDIWKDPNRIPLLASFDFPELQDTRINQKISVFLVTGSKRSVVRYTPSTYNRFSFDPTQDNMLIAVLPGNKVAIFTKEDFADMDIETMKGNKSKENRSAHTFRMKVQEEAIASMEDLKSMMDVLG